MIGLRLLACPGCAAAVRAQDMGLAMEWAVMQAPAENASWVQALHYTLALCAAESGATSGRTGSPSSTAGHCTICCRSPALL